MKLLAYQAGSSTKCGVLINDHVIPVAELLNTADPLADVRALLELPDRPLDRLADALQSPNADGIPLTQIQFRAPVLRPPTVRDFMVFEEHVTQQFTSTGDLGKFGRLDLDSWRRLPVFYFSNPLNILGTDQDLIFPGSTQTLDFETEIGMIIAKEGTNVEEEDCADYIAGFTVMNDWSLRDAQADEMGMLLGPAKGKDCGTSLGPLVVTPDEFGSAYANGVLSINSKVTVNGEVWGERNTWNMIHSFHAMIMRASQDSRIAAGDVIGSGTIGGGTVLESARLGYPARWLQPGDVVEVELEHNGVLRTRIAAPTRSREKTPYAPSFAMPVPSPISAEDRAAVLKRVAKPN